MKKVLLAKKLERFSIPNPQVYDQTSDWLSMTTNLAYFEKASFMTKKVLKLK
jgi:hypothetical protein